ncbi:hypothetical protein BDV38DRAFT_269254 [Aspergillus pseudotamarii]|uniref:Carrier domain-containing protein n=1 Tax=Aspergillus pseudotamarii TaxID=132259 RepID=A0A5N6T1T5_ASPPS|nr:uncharacterized protein BDV38DRAFT_269254 [Aspergillus pseudotamarii]KAE8140256.1 hypothetical protein BDV38DRAFT_269254 [Aspergillus pseudotamarii]
MELICCYQTLWRNLPESVRDGKSANWNSIIQRTRQRINDVTPSMSQLIPSDSSQPALMDPESHREISYTLVQEVVKAFDLGLECSHRKPRVVVVLPNGPCLALAALAVANRYTFVPMTSAVAPDQLKKDIEAVEADAVLILDKDVQKFGLKLDLSIFAVHIQEDLTITTSCVKRSDRAGCSRASPNGPEDLAMVLFTSGTSGKKKLVPITMMNLLASAILTGESLGLNATSRCLNMMPLHHIGGLIRSVWAPLFAGGTTICCPSFDPTQFWTGVKDWQPTWYYATPTMHQMILAQAKYHADTVNQSSIRFLHKLFKCNVFPSYGMTECAPIAAPPLSYNLERIGSSGLPAGPDLGILDISQSEQRCPAVFPGYLTAQGINKGCFDTFGWFDTGDLGYMDEAGYLYVTGRSKEVINRGGEIISPIEVDDALLSAAGDASTILFRRITEALAFSMPHEVFQEVVGVVIVTAPGEKRPDLRQLQEGLKGRLEQPKWPTIVVYMDQVPKIGNKLCRIGLSDRLGLEMLTDKTPTAQCHYEGRFSQSGTSVRRCSICPELVKARIKQVSGVSDVLIRPNPLDGFLHAILFDSPSHFMPPENIITSFQTRLDGYLIPSSIRVLEGPIPRKDDGSIDNAMVDALVQATNDASLSPTERRVCGLFFEVLQCPATSLGSTSEFFSCGGDSMTAGRLVSRLRQDFRIHLPADMVFRHSTVGEISDLIDTAGAEAASKEAGPQEYPGCRETYCSTNPIVLMLNLLPIGIFYPMLQSLNWTLFIYLMSETSSRWPLRGSLMGRLLHIVLARLAIQLFVGIFCPLLGIVFKWLVIGRYRAGMYPMWGPYHMRWWLTESTPSGFFNGHYWSRVLYYRALSVRIGSNVQRNTSMLLQPIQIGAYCTVGLRAVLAPGCSLAPGTCLGPNTSSWETKDAGEFNRDLALLVGLAERLPMLAGIILLVNQHPNPMEEDTFKRQVFWFADSARLGQYILVKAYGAVVGPFAWFLAVLFVKGVLDVFCGRPRPGPYKHMSQRQKLRSAVLDRVFPRGDLSRLTRIIGTHYEPFSIIVRMLGGRIGERIYWPICELTMIEDYDMLEIGNDVVFGSRSSMMTADGIGRGRIVIGDGAFVGDRVVALPGVTVGKRTTLGSGALLRRDGEYPDDTAWAGSRHGDELRPRRNHNRRVGNTSEKHSIHDDDTSTPFGRAFYEGQANYHVLAIVVAVYPTVSVLTGLLVVRRLLRIGFSGLEANWWRPLSFYGIFTLVIAVMVLLQTLAVVGITIAAKWMPLGQRREGYYPWDMSSYSQRWQIMLAIQELIDQYPGNIGVLTLISGTAYLPVFYRAMGATVVVPGYTSFMRPLDECDR